ncbi:hypothetical protein, partial [Yersinia pestis]|uniref:hypothetical protein n=1 Tax=Yersinia pestis TaxID=632 RepID=UPI0019806F1C
PSYFKLQMRWPPSLTPVTYRCKLLGIRSIAAFLPLELFRVISVIFQAADALAAFTHPSHLPV